MSKESDEYLTPPSTASAVNDFFFGPVGLDPYAHKDQFVQARFMRTIEDKDEPLMPNVGTMYSNPPFSETKTILPELVRFSFVHGLTSLFLVPASPGSAYWAKSVWKAPNITRIAWLKRQTFYGFKNGEACECANTIRQDTVMLLAQGDLNDPFRRQAELSRFKSIFGPLSRCITTAEAV